MSADIISIQKAGAVPGGQSDIFILFLNHHRSGWEKNGITEVYAQNQQKLSTFWTFCKINGISYEMNELPLAAIDYH